MCGIAGIFSLNRTIAVNSIEKMILALEHRGPDSINVYKDHHTHLGSSRLSFLDLQGGDQPIYNEDRTIMTVFNGEIYNYREIRQRLQIKGHHFKTETDTEVLVHLYEEYGADMIDKLEGQFAFAIYNKREKYLFIARDRMGICPLYYMQKDNVFYFSSEIKSLAQLNGFSVEADEIGLAQSLKFWATISPRTVFKNVYSLPIGHHLTLDSSMEPTIKRYHGITDYHNSLDIKNIDELHERIRTTLTEAVKRRMFSDPNVKIGAYVSGGVDSAIITHLINDIGMNDFTTFSLSFEDAAFDESRYQQDCVNMLNSDHIEVKISYDEIPKHFPDSLRHTEYPFFRSAPVPMYLLSKAVKESGCKAVLSGEGADEIFYGYDIFKEVLVRRFWTNNQDSDFRPGKLKDVFYYNKAYDNQANFNFLKGFYERSLQDTHNALYPLLPQWQNGEGLFPFFSGEIKNKLQTNDLNNELMNLLPNDFRLLSDLKRCQGLQMELLLGGYLLSSQGDRVLSANSVEGRFPFLDENVVSLAYNIPDSLKLNGLQEKHVLREAFKGSIPESIRSRKKFPYRAPEAKVFFNGKTIDYVETLTSQKIIEEYGIFDYKKVNRLISKFKKFDDVSRFSTRDNLMMIFILGTQMLMKYARNGFVNEWAASPNMQILK